VLLRSSNRIGATINRSQRRRKKAIRVTIAVAELDRRPPPLRNDNGRNDDGQCKAHRWHRGIGGCAREVSACRHAHDCVDPRHISCGEGLVVAVLDSKAALVAPAVKLSASTDWTAPIMRTAQHLDALDQPRDQPWRYRRLRLWFGLLTAQLEARVATRLTCVRTGSALQAAVGPRRGAAAPNRARLPEACLHRLGHRHVSFEAERFRHRAITTCQLPVGIFVPAGSGEQGAQP
jgi:hypothetical protein